MANWYGIEGIAFHYRGAWADPEITVAGVTDSVCVDVEDTMWDRYREEGFTDTGEGFAQYMRDHRGEVLELIALARIGAVHSIDEPLELAS